MERRPPEDEPDYGEHSENDEGDSSVRAGSYDAGRVENRPHHDNGQGRPASDLKGRRFRRRSNRSDRP